MPVTTRIISADSGSSRKPQVTLNRPTPLLVCSGICGIHSATLMSNARASAGWPSNRQNPRSDSPSAAVIVAQATSPAVLRENARMPARPLMAAPMRGRSGMSQIYRMLESAIGDRAIGDRRSLNRPLPPHEVHLVDIDRFLVAVERQ